MKSEEIKTKLNLIFREFFTDAEIELTRETTALDIFGWDSLSHVELLLNVEDQFDIRFNRNEIINLDNVGELLDLIAGKV